MNRILFLDTETTQLSLDQGKIVEIGIVECIDYATTNNNFHSYLNPGINIEPGATRVHGITNEMVADKPYFKDIATQFIEYINGSIVVMHNAIFDTLFINKELSECNQEFKKLDYYCSIFDTLDLSRKIYTNSNTLDDICKRYQISLANRNFHGAIIDAELLRQAFFKLVEDYSNKNHDEVYIGIAFGLKAPITDFIKPHNPKLFVAEPENDTTHHQMRHALKIKKLID